MQTLDESIKLVHEAFEDKTGYYFHTLPHSYSNFIDGMAWVGLLCGSSLLVGDEELANKCQIFLQNLIDVGPDARNYAPVQVSDSWKKSRTLPNFWYKEKEQSFAGPLGLLFAIKCGADLRVPPYLLEKAAWGQLLTKFGFLFGIGAKFIPTLRQHLDTIFLAYLLSEQKPSSTLLWACEENPFFSYINKEKCSVEYPSNVKLTDLQKIPSKKIVPLSQTKGSSWIFRRDPFVKHEGTKTSTSYVPIWHVVGEYLQSTL